MRRSKALARIRAGQPVRMVAMGSPLPFMVRLEAHHGFDCIWLDLEHRAMDHRDLQGLLAFFHLFDIDCMVRVPTLEKTKLYRYLEDGAAGLMVPHVSTPEKAQMLVQALKFPPLGDRGLDGAGLDADFYMQGGPTFTDDANRETFLTVQIETPEAVENVEKIAAVEGVDSLFIGPGDLSLRLRTTGSSLTLDHVIDRVAAAAKRHGRVWGMPVGSGAQLKNLADRGARFCNYGGEFLAVMQMLERHAKEMDEAYAEVGSSAASETPGGRKY
ncbi:MAG: 4-hydroxy-2-oxovalerate aldolase [Planctomycetaceae bacterium]|nr:4-hydroxy-2-oxovalerate aldolase [Planctomycetaceae bacterium]